jgi:predicted AlkP superfamily pyrophosphatase or phosphodiesterase
MIYCAEDEGIAGTSSDDYVVSPAHLRVPTLGDRMKRADPRTRSVAVSVKDRAAVMLGGHFPDQRWWWDGRAFVSHEGRTVPASVATINAAVVDQLSLARAASAVPQPCEARHREVAIEGGGAPVGAGRFAREAGNARAWRASPDADAAVLSLASRLRSELELGKDEVPDLLAIGLSATDYVGHAYGTRGAEMCLQLLQLDASLASFFSELDNSGVDYLVVLTADHGGLDIPERARQQGMLEARRADPALDVSAIDAMLRERLGVQQQVLWGEFVSGEMYIGADLPQPLRERALQLAVDAYRTHTDVAAVFTASEIASTPMPSGDPQAWSLIERARASFDLERSGDFLVMLKPNVTAIYDTGGGYIAGHGSPWEYDRQVPILFWRKGVRPFEQPLAVETVDILPTIAALIRLPVPSEEIDGRCLDILQGPDSSCARP